jgi:MFS family permease
MSESTVAHPAVHREWSQTFHALGNRNFRLYWLGMLVSSLGTRLQMLALAWLVLRLTGSGFALGTVVMAEAAPILLFALFGGVIADRLPKQPVLLLTQSAMLMQALVLGILVSLGSINLCVIYALSAVVGLAEAIDTPTSQAFIKDLVGSDKEELGNATELLSTLFNATKVVGPAIGGMLVAAFGEAACFYINALSFLAVITTLLLVDRRRLYPTPTPRRERIFTQIRSGLTYSLSSADIATIVLLLAAVGLFGYNLGVLLPLIARQLIVSGPMGLGLLSTALGVGALVGSLVVDSMGMSARRDVLTGAVTFTVMFLALALFDGWLLILIITVVLGFGSALFLATASARLQILASDDFRGQIMGIYTPLLFGTTPLGSVLAGSLAERIGVRQTIALLAVSCGLGLMATFVYLRRHRDSLLPDLADDPLVRGEEWLSHRLSLYWYLFRRH